jgi:putative CocE/NonD family hydrolase
VGAVDFGPEASSDIDREQIRWFDRFLKDDGEPQAPVRLFDLGARAWRDLAAWPEPEPQAWHLSSTGLAVARTEDGRLEREPPPNRPLDILVHDPWRPVPSLGGHDGQPPGPQDRAALDGRADVACYTSAPLAAPLPLAGRVAAELDVTADADSHDLLAVLSQVTPDGRVLTLTQGYLRRAGSGPCRVAMRAICATVPAGAALRLSLQGSSFPAFTVNPGTGAGPTDTRLFDCRIVTFAIGRGRMLLPVETSP